jgi:hypothetical protein
MLQRPDYFRCDGGFASLTLRVRLPSIVERLFLDWPDMGADARGQLRELQRELVEDRPLTQVKHANLVWGKPWSEYAFLHVEVLIYMRILDSFGYFDKDNDNFQVDPFLKQKDQSKEMCFEQMRARLQGPRLSLEEALLASFWGNKTDLSLHSLSEVRNNKREIYILCKVVFCF